MNVGIILCVQWMCVKGIISAALQGREKKRKNLLLENRPKSATLHFSHPL